MIIILHILMITQTSQREHAINAYNKTSPCAGALAGAWL